MGDCHRLQHDFDPLESEMEQSQMKINPIKCKVMHFGRSDRAGHT